MNMKILMGLLLLMCLIAPSYAAFPTSGILAFYKLDNNDFNNSVSASYVLSNTGTTNTTGIIGDGRACSGVAQYLNNSDSSALFNSSSAFSVGGWFNTTTIASYKMAVAQRSGASAQFHLQSNSGAWETCIYNASGSTCCLATSSMISVNKLYNVFVVFNGTDAGNLTIYVNGTKYASVKCGSANFTYIANLSSSQFRICNNDPIAPTQLWSGTVDEIGIWNIALNSSQVSDYYASGNSSAYPVPAMISNPANTTYFSSATIPISVTFQSTYSCNVTSDGALKYQINGTGTYSGSANNSVGYHNISVSCNQSANYFNSSVYYSVLNQNNLTLSINPGWTAYSGQTISVSCTALNGTPNLYIQSVLVSSPYIFTAGIGTYTVLCNISANGTYAANNESNNLVVSSTPGCANSSAYAFSSNITTATNITTLNMTALVTQGYLRADLKDVYALNVSGAWVNLTGASGQYFVVNNTNKTSFTLQFGNYLINNTYSSASINNTQNLTIYSGINPYAIINIFDEINYTSSYPPSTTVIAGLFCSGGQNYFTITPNITKVLIALTSQPTRVSLRPQYSAIDYYQRAQYNFANQTSYLFDFYLADGMTYLVVPVTFVMQDVDKLGYLLQVYRTVGAQTQIISEGYFDVSGSDTESLIQGIDYSLRVRSPSGVYYNLGTVNAPGAVTKYLFTSTQNLTPGLNYSSSLIHVDAAFSPNSSIALANITVNYTDLSYALSTVTVTIYNDTGVANTSIIANTWNFSTVILYGANTSKNYYVKYTILTPSGSVTMGKIVSGTFTGFNLGLPSVWLQIMGIAIIFFVMLAIGSPNQIMSSGIIIIAVMALEMGMGWLILDSGQLLILGLLLMLGMGIAYFSRGER